MSKTTKATNTTRKPRTAARNGSPETTVAEGITGPAGAVTEEAAAPVALEIIEETAPDVRMFRPGEVIPWPGLNPRTDDGDPEAEAKQAELDASVRQHGVKQPALVHLRDEGPHWLVMGSRRLVACEHTGRMLPAVVGTYTEAEAFELALVENIQRADLSPIQEARGFRRWLEQHPDGTEYTLAEKMGKSQPYVSHRLGLLRLPEGAQRLVAERLVTATQARDAFLPFATVPEAARGPLFESVELRVREYRAANPGDRPNLTTLKAFFGAAAIPLSNPLSAADAGPGDAVPLFDPKDHAKKCGCNGPTWLYRNWGAPQARCFNPEWWNAKQDAVRRTNERDEQKRRAEVKQREEEAQRRADDARKSGGETPPPAPAPVEDARTLYHNAVTLADSATDFRRMALLVDPTLIPAESLRIVAGWEPFRAAHSLICTDRASLVPAIEAGRAARVELIRRLTEERNAQEREEAGRMDLRAPEVLADLLAALPNTTHAALARVADQHDLTVPANAVKREDWLTLPKRDLQLFARVVVLRVRAGTLNTYKDPVEADAERQLLDEYSAKLDALRAVVSFPRPPFVERMDSLAERFYAAHGPLAAQAEGGELSESAGEAIQGLQEIVASMRALYDEAAAAGADLEPLSFDGERERFDALSAAYEAKHGATADDATPNADGGAEEEGEATTAAETEARATEEDAPASDAVREEDPAAVTGAPEGSAAESEVAARPGSTDELASRRRGGRKGEAEELAAS